MSEAENRDVQAFLKCDFTKSETLLVIMSEAWHNISPAPPNAVAALRHNYTAFNSMVKMISRKFESYDKMMIF